MADIMPLESLGPRIVIMGPTNAGKSTLCKAISEKLHLPPVYLDQLHHQPNTDWVARPKAEFHGLQRDAIAQESWIMDGNYSGLIAERLARATGAILVDEHYTLRFARYIRRTLFERHRPGSLAGAQDSLKWSMIHWIWKTRNSYDRYHAMVAPSGLPLVTCRSLRQVNRLYDAWGLDGP